MAILLPFYNILHTIPDMNKNETWFVDVGNSSIQYINQTELNQGVVKFMQTDLCTKADLEKKFYGKKLYICSVVPKLTPLFKEIANCSFVDASVLPGIHVAIQKPAEVGADRLVNAFAAFKLYGGPVLVIDSGTAITCCVVDKDGNYLGGAIMPGMGIASKALNDYTAKVPLIWVKPQQAFLGQSTKQAVEVGLYHGYIHMINGMINQLKQAYDIKHVIGTGQGVAVLKDKLTIDCYDEKLVFRGLNLIVKEK